MCIKLVLSYLLTYHNRLLYRCCQHRPTTVGCLSICARWVYYRIDVRLPSQARSTKFDNIYSSVYATRYCQHATICCKFHKIPQHVGRPKSQWNDAYDVTIVDRVISGVCDFMCGSACPRSKRNNTTWAINTKLGTRTLYGRISACIDPKGQRSRSRGYEMWCRRVYACRYDCLGF